MAANNDSGNTRWGVRLDPTVNYGHLLSAAVFLTTAAMGWAALSARQEHAETRIARLDARIESLTRTLQRVETFLDNETRRGQNNAPNRSGG